MRLTTFKQAYRLPYFLIFSILITGCNSSSDALSTSTGNEEITTLRDTQFVMGTVATITLYNFDDESVLNDAFDVIYNLEKDLSFTTSDTLLNEVNDAAGISPVKVNDALYNIVEKGLYYSLLTDGSFDLTIGPLVNLWRIGFKEANVPILSDIEDVLPLIDFNQVTLNQTHQTIYLENAGMQLDLGGIAKGYTADQVAAFLIDSGVKHALIDLGGNVFTLGTKVDGTLWRVGIQDPFQTRGETIGVVTTSNQSVVTSGIYERFLETEEASYHHILNPKTGYPFDNELAGVTIVSNTSLDGDALSTAVFSKGLEEGLNLIHELVGVDAIFITKDYKVYVSDGLKEHFILNNTAFTLAN